MVTRLEMHDRQSRILHPHLQEVTAFVAGAGMVGSWAALALVRAVGAVHVWDDDTVEAANVGVQAYDGVHVGQYKTDALSLLAQDPPIVGHVGRFPDDDTIWVEDDTFHMTEAWGDVRAENVVVVCAVDSMAGRREIAEWSRDNHVGLFIETGVHAELVVIKTATSSEDYERYLSGLPADDEVEDAQCGLKGTAYAGMSLASQIVPFVNHWASERPLPDMRLFHTGFFLDVSPASPEEGREVASED